LSIIRRCAEFLPREKLDEVPRKTRGIYALLRRKSRKRYDVVYVGMACGRRGIRGRLKKHSRSKRKGKRWTHFSLYQVRKRIGEREIKELEGLLRHIYRKDTRVNILNLQRGFKKLKKVRVNDLNKWKSN